MRRETAAETPLDERGALGSRRGYGDFTRDAQGPGPRSPVRRCDLRSTAPVSRPEASLSARSAASSWARCGALVAMVTADLRGVPEYAATRPSSGRGVQCVSWSHRLLWREPADEDHPPLLTMRTDHRLDGRHRLCVGRHKCRNDRVLRRIELGRLSTRRRGWLPIAVIVPSRR